MSMMGEIKLFFGLKIKQTNDQIFVIKQSMLRNF